MVKTKNPSARDGGESSIEDSVFVSGLRGVGIVSEQALESNRGLHPHELVLLGLVAIDQGSATVERDPELSVATIRDRADRNERVAVDLSLHVHGVGVDPDQRSRLHPAQRLDRDRSETGSDLLVPEASPLV